jgi:hypothetical protein
MSLLLSWAAFFRVPLRERRSGFPIGYTRSKALSTPRAFYTLPTYKTPKRGHYSPRSWPVWTSPMRHFPIDMEQEFSEFVPGVANLAVADATHTRN